MPATDVATCDLNEPELDVLKNGFVIGNDVQFNRTIINALFGDTPINAWLTIKSSPAASDVSGVQSPVGLTSTGYGIILPGQMQLFINLRSQDTIAQLDAGPLYYYDIKVQMTPSGNLYTIEQGFIQFMPEVGDAPVPLNASATLPPGAPTLLFGSGAPPAGTYAVGTRWWVTQPVEGFPAEYVYTANNVWKVVSVVSV